ncbi:helix-turn-helix domain-containing protein [Nocardiopsis sp. JB363]|uniref:helix-turn-helix domain-containing protein n=1 Tax=Nocardiopsis sp. JB363 TaxID=1434837 RepID=UPI00097A5EA0|nr:hypothetical protein [Nocardiopsis sp. JB363]SIO87342.1 hypothetical protein BQ8420_16030 [Nocardiopsis sp. JB363]
MESTERLEEIAGSIRGGNTLEALESLVELRSESERVEAVLVRRARNQGLTWARIAEALGVSKQAIHKKYGGRGLLGSRK